MEKGSALPTLACACGSLRRAARAVSLLYDGELRSTGLNTPQFTLLQALGRSGSLTQGSLARLLALDNTTLSRTLAPLERRRWIHRTPGKDRRERWVELTKAGRLQLDRAMPTWERAQRRLRSKITSGRWEALLGELAALAGAALEA